jgi:hypothetical protein
MGDWVTMLSSGVLEGRLELLFLLIASSGQCNVMQQAGVIVMEWILSHPCLRNSKSKGSFCTVGQLREELQMQRQNAFVDYSISGGCSDFLCLFTLTDKQGLLIIVGTGISFAGTFSTYCSGLHVGRSMILQGLVKSSIGTFMLPYFPI